MRTAGISDLFLLLISTTVKFLWQLMLGLQELCSVTGCVVISGISEIGFVRSNLWERDGIGEGTMCS